MLHIPPRTPQAKFLLTAKSHPATLSSEKQIPSASIQIPEIVSLPASTSTARPEPAATVYVTTNEILLENKKIADVRDVLQSRETSIGGLERALSYQAARLKGEARSKGKVIIMGDKAIPFTLLKRVMHSCSKAGYPVITLAVIQRE